MPAKTKSPDGNSNNNINTNTNNNTINVNIKYPEKRYSKPKYSSVKQKDSPNWYTRTILGGLILLVLSVCGYYIKQRIGDKGKADPGALPYGNQIEGIKQN